MIWQSQAYFDDLELSINITVIGQICLPIIVDISFRAIMTFMNQNQFPVSYRIVFIVNVSVYDDIWYQFNKIIKPKCCKLFLWVLDTFCKFPAGYRLKVANIIQILLVFTMT